MTKFAVNMHKPDIKLIFISTVTTVLVCFRSPGQSLSSNMDMNRSLSRELYQRFWTLDECIAKAMEDNIDIRTHAMNAEEKRIEGNCSFVKLLPYVSFYIGENFNWGKSVDMQELVIIDNRSVSSTSLSLSGSADIMKTVSNAYAAGALQEEYRMEVLECCSLRNDIRIKVVRAYMELLLSRQTRIDADNNYRSISEQERRTRIEVESGLKSGADLMEIEAKAASEKAEASYCAGKEQLARLALMKLLNIRGDTPFEIFLPEESDIPRRVDLPPIDDIYTIVGEMPQIKEAILNKKMEKHRQIAQLTACLPTVQITGGYGSYFSSTIDKGFWKQMDGNRNPSLSMTLSIPILNGGELLSKIRTVRVREAEASLQVESAREELFNELESIVIETDAEYERCVAAYSGLKASEEVLRTAEIKYNQGALSSTDYIIARSNMHNARSAYLQAKFQYMFNIMIIDCYRNSAAL